MPLLSSKYHLHEAEPCPGGVGVRGGWQQRGGGHVTPQPRGEGHGGLALDDDGGRLGGAQGQLALEQEVVQRAGEEEVLNLVTSSALQVNSLVSKDA